MPKKKKKTFSLSKIETDQILYNFRQLTLFGVINDKTSNKLIQEILALDLIASDIPIVIWINSPGGSVASGFSIVDMMNRVNSKIITIVCGYACSMASVISISGNQRLMTPNSIWMSHDGRGSANDYFEKAIARVEHFKDITKNIHKIYQKKTNLTKKDLDKAVSGELWLTATQCKKKNIVDKILKNKRK